MTCVARTTAAGGEILEGSLRCEDCKQEYPIAGAIPRFVKDDDYADSFGLQWNRFRTEQLDPCNGTTYSEQRFRTETGWDSSGTRDEWTLDAGCGAGRFLEVASRGQAQVVGIDLSRAVDAARENLFGRENVHLVQASIYQLPFRKGTFGRGYSLGVIQHTPDPLGALSSIAEVVRPGGELAVTIYEKRRFTHLNAKYWFRPITRLLPPGLLLWMVRVLAPFMFAVSELLFRIPKLGRVFRFLIPFANYVDMKDLTMRQRYRWAVMDTFDMLSPRFDAPQTEYDVTAKLRASGFVNVHRGNGAGLNLIATKERVAAEVTA